MKGLLKDGGSKRRAVARQAVESVGGKVEAFYFAFGTNDVVAVVDAPDNVSIAAVSLAIAASGSFAGHTTVLLTPEEVDQATQKAVRYTPPVR